MLKFDTPTNFVLEKVISGGQIGADEAGLYAARKVGFKTGGTAPFGYRTQRGANDSLRTLYNLEQDQSYSYKPRTIKNVENSDGTLIIAKNMHSPGCLLTSRTAIQKRKPLCTITVPDAEPSEHQLVWWVGKVSDFLKEHRIKILNVAGNRDHIPGNYPLSLICHRILIPVFESAYRDYSESFT